MEIALLLAMPLLHLLRNQTFQIFARSDVIALINEVGDIEKPVPLGIRLLKDVPEFRRMAARATWALLTG